MVKERLSSAFLSIDDDDDDGCDHIKRALLGTGRFRRIESCFDPVEEGYLLILVWDDPNGGTGMFSYSFSSFLCMSHPTGVVSNILKYHDEIVLGESDEG